MSDCLQLNLLVDQVESAVTDFQKSVSLCPDFAIAHVQKCYTGKKKNMKYLKLALFLLQPYIYTFSSR